MIKQDTFVSVVLVSENQAEKLTDYISRLEPYLKGLYSDYEIVVIDQNSSDNTEELLDSTLSNYQSIRYIKLAQTVSSDVALAAGIENSIGDFVININLELDPVSLIDRFISDGKAGNDIIIGVSESTTSTTYKFIRNISDKLIHSIGYTLPANSTGSFCLSRRAVNAITESGRFYCKLHMRIANIGYNIKPISYDLTSRCENKRIINGVKETIHHMIFNSTKPLRWMSMLGVFGSFMAFVFACYSLIVNIINDNVTAGWTTTILFMSFLFAILFTMLAFFGEYLSRLLNDRSEHKEYNVVFEKNSSVMLENNRHNVIFSSLIDDKNLTKTRRDK
ncbi:glycosyltransferase [Photobacterium sp. SDRW27]|uniref:glycosyltransferase n=1 Tax=Photobacterium obscurum TaxID=2829490 RepID=UPI002244DA4B|nr:glycosyltransferase [Photobacterium obscurum]MCW8327458.1 glycosyltransferase [Photobacterium obscurum]